MLGKIVPYDKMSKRKQKEYNKKRRTFWDNINPITKIIPNKKKSKKDEERTKSQYEEMA